MPIQDKATLKSYFEDGKLPTESEYIDLIDSIGDMNKSVFDSDDDGVVDDAEMVSAYGLGTQAVDISNQDLNSYINTGFYRGDNVTNAPTTSRYYFLVIRHSSTYIYQEAIFAYGTGGVLIKYGRKMQGGTWYPWAVIHPADWNDITNIPSTFPPSTHLHDSEYYRKDATLSSPSYDIRTGQGFVAGDVNVNPSVGDVIYTATLKSRKNSINYEVYGLRTLSVPVSGSTPWNGGAGQSTQSNTQIDVSSIFGGLDTLIENYVDSWVMVVAIRDSGAGSTDCRISFKNFSGGNILAQVDCHPSNDRYHRTQRIIKAGANGDVWVDIVASGSGTFDVILQIIGYTM